MSTAVVTEQAARVESLARRAIDDRVFPGAVVHVRHEGRIIWHQAYGWTAIVPDRRAMRPDTVFDLASLTKPMATATAVLQLWEQGALDLDRPVARYLPEFAAAGKESITLRHLLTHTSGLPAWIRLYLHARSPEEGIRLICQTAPGFPPASRSEYSDLGFIALGELVARASGLRLDDYVAQRVAPVLGWRWTRFRPPASWRERCAATEEGNEYERKAAGVEGEGYAWRFGVIAGETHDGNSHYLFDGVAGHAGLFSIADEVGRFGQAMLDGGRWGGGRLLAEATVAEATQDHTGHLGDGRDLGWRCRRGAVFMGTRASARGYGHTGFTGTSLVVDPDRALVAVLLTNRVHPRADDTRIDDFRAVFHDALMEVIG